MKHDAATRKNIPTAEFESVMPEADKTAIQLAYDRRNRDPDPQLLWRGNDERDSSDLIVSAQPLYIQDKVRPRVIIDDLKRGTRLISSSPPSLSTSRTRCVPGSSSTTLNAGRRRALTRPPRRWRTSSPISTGCRTGQEWPPPRSGRQQPCYQKPIPAANLSSPCCKRPGGTPSRIPSRNSALSRMAVSSRSVRVSFASRRSGWTTSCDTGGTFP